MSLLMDALNKAEQAKRQGAATEKESSLEHSTDSPPLSLELTPLILDTQPAVSPEPDPVPPALPELPEHLGMLDEEFIAHAAAAKPGSKLEKPVEKMAPRAILAEAPAAIKPPAPAPTATKAAAATMKAEAQDREAAQNLFDVKQPPPPRTNKRLLVIVGVMGILAAAGIGVYFWLQLQPSSGLGIAKPVANIQRPAPIPPPQPAPTPAPAVATAPVVAEKPPVAAPARPVTAPVRAEQPGTFQVTTAKLTLNPGLASAYEAYLVGNYAAARNDYLQVLKAEPSNLDALHGLAAISLRQGQYAGAEEYYLRAIEADPKDALAQAGLISLKGQVDPQLAESRLNALLAAQPDQPFLHFALGNLYAKHKRWNEAQAAFFRAYSGEPDNPDALFNLAVSLDQLHQPKLAVQYYSLALAAAGSRPASFDKAQVSARLRDLQP